MTHLALQTFLLSLCLSSLLSQDLAKRVTALADGKAFESLHGAFQFASDGPNGEKVLRIDGGFSGRIDLKPLGIDPLKYDLMKVEVKSDRASFLRFSLENFPDEGELSHWYVLDSMRGPFEWKTIWLDLRRPEEIKQPGKYKGLAAKDPSLRGLQIMGHMRDTRRSIQEPGHNMWLRSIRFVKKAIDVDWDQTKATYTWDNDLVFRYPVTVTNRLNRPVKAKLSILPFNVRHAFAKLSTTSLALNASERKQVEVTVGLPSKVASESEPLYCERFELRAIAEGIEDSEVTILRSSDPIHLTVTIPLKEENLQFPFFPQPKELPDYIQNYIPEVAGKAANSLTPEALDTALKFEGDPNTLNADAISGGISSAAFIYHHTGDRSYLKKVRDALVRMAQLYSKVRAAIYSREHEIISHGVLSGNTLHYGFRFGGTQRPPYNYGGGSGNDASGSMHGIYTAFDMVAADLTAKDRDFIVTNLMLPAAVQERNQYIGPGNQQCTTNYVVLYGGLAARNWPLVSFAYSAEHGLLDNLKWAFDDDGLCLEGHYQAYTISPMLWMAELLYGRGIDIYQERFFNIVHSKGADAIGMGYSYPIMRFLDEKRFAGKEFIKRSKEDETDGYHLTGSTLLKWKELQVSMNWGTHIFRSSRDRCALTIRTPRKSKDRELRKLTCGGGSYNHSSFGQSILIVDEGHQNSKPGNVISYDVRGPVQHVMCASDQHYRGSTITRTFALLSRHVLVVDRFKSGKASTVDWYLKSAGSKLSVPSETKEGAWTAKPNDNRVGATFGANIKSYRYGKTDSTWTEGSGRLTMLGSPGTELFSFKGATRPHFMARRKGVKQTDFIAFFSNQTKAVIRVPVKRTDGLDANAVGVKISLKDGKVFRAIVSFELPGTEVVADGLKTAEKFATDFE
ncbi:MAG: hypothetical protein QGG53_32190 [Planctomycetota bacterium]|jgi:hypothetical protein|nr:hypothetical protein [Planctomycetota bacterium]